MKIWKCAEHYPGERLDDIVFYTLIVTAIVLFIVSLMAN